MSSYSGNGNFLLEVSGSSASSSNKLPVASFTETCTDLNCTFSDTSKDEDGTIVSWNWTENGQPIGSGEKVSVNFKEGLHTVLLTVTDNDGLTGLHETTATVLKGGDGGGGGSGPDCSANPAHPKCK
ncbi:PKD domain-containing protein [Nitrosomonas sp. Nm132]|uniref:PKD domain-containing protein n=1 Tax=Nitrosomonas sp. Nm132 TaxID=1881053 RepID=UPI00115FD426|nr:PKD domain-containing protein [Nitrosomonas sp. Nm132]